MTADTIFPEDENFRSVVNLLGDLLSKYRFIALPSVVSPEGWDLIFTPSKVTGDYVMEEQVQLALDPMLDPVTTP